MSADPPSQTFCTLVCAKKDECVKECNSLLDFITQDQNDQKSLDVPGFVSGQIVSGQLNELSNLNGVYKVQPGDTCWSIADAKCSDGNGWENIICNADQVCKAGLQTGAPIQYDCTGTGKYCR